MQIAGFIVARLAAAFSLANFVWWRRHREL